MCTYLVVGENQQRYGLDRRIQETVVVKEGVDSMEAECKVLQTAGFIGFR
jgi:hypothetical protein